MTADTDQVEDGGPPTDPDDPFYALTARGLLADFNRAGILSATDVHVATRVGALAGERDPEVLLAGALAVRALRHGSVCVDLTGVRPALSLTPAQAALAWPEPTGWVHAVARSPMTDATADPVLARPLRLDAGLLYLDKYWRQERTVAGLLNSRTAQDTPTLDPDRLQAALQRLLPDDADQRLAAALAVIRPVTVIAGGPGTGKTTTVARLLAAALDQPRRARVALTAPTGKAAARLQEAIGEEAERMPPADAARVQDLTAGTIHRLLGRSRTSRTGFRHGPDLPLPYDIVVVDESSMVSLTLMAALMAALGPSTQLVLVGDPDQLSSVEAGAVLGDIVARPGPGTADGVGQVLARVVPDLAADGHDAARRGVCVLRTRHRFGGAIAALADAIRDGDSQAAGRILLEGGGELELTADVAGLRADVVRTGRAVWQAAAAGDGAAALEAMIGHRLLCAHRHGPFGASWWGESCRRWLAEDSPGQPVTGRWYTGRPLLALQNKPRLGVYNGDTGVVVAGPHGPQAVFGSAAAPLPVAPGRLPEVDSLYAMTIHKSQGSQFQDLTVVLPPPGSPLLTRELLYTAVTRARRRVRLLGDLDAVTAAVQRPVQRASGLRRR